MPILVYAHRSASGIRPENTMPTILEAIKQGADGIETDVQMSRAGAAWALINIKSYPMVVDALALFCISKVRGGEAEA